MSETELAKSMNEFLTKLQDDLKEAMNSMMCSKCQGKHRYSMGYIIHSTEQGVVGILVAMVINQ